MMIKIDEDQLYSIIVQELSNTLKFFEEELEAGDSFLFYWHEPELEKRDLIRHIEAAKLLLDWYK